MIRIQYPTPEEAEDADRGMLCYYHRFLPSPGNPWETAIMDTIRERYTEAGGYTTALSKLIGWDPDDYQTFLRKTNE